jgi:type II secretory ATPase GspE/PulE/Tfp pilus assembly ATPase PilB-like protein
MASVRTDSLRDLLHRLFQEQARPSAIIEALLEGAAEAGGISDIHFEPVDGGLEIRIRLDGVLTPLAAAPPELSGPLIARLKVLAGLASYRTDVPQDGRIDGGAAGASRLATYPTVRGEKAVVRLLLATPEAFDLDILGLSDRTRGVLVHAVAAREGMVVLTGPAGSGKTTTLYTLLRHICATDSVPRQIVTIEDPAECLLPRVTQTQINLAVGLTMANCLRSILRQDPEVLMVGEVRDRETAALAVEAALTGHLVLTTIHAGRAAGVFGRLLEMGIEPYQITSILRAAVAVRLVRRLCVRCTVEGVALGCEACWRTGYRGRLLLDESLTLEGAVRDAVLRRADVGEIERTARESGMETLAERGQALVTGLFTTLDEVRRVLASG